ncbi:hypothetical protein LJC61_02985 [Ruminococcaceae bacterium OttesenSCG-928-A16]|nr:hypothetical protein [Ruminococcaceae bacterium OttesenSCG-928-A16]
MKKISTAATMRRVAGCLFGALAVYMMLCISFILGGASLANGPMAWVVELGLVILFAVYAAWLLAKDEEVSPALRRATVVGGVMVALFELINYKTLTDAINYTLSNWFPGDGLTQPDFGIWVFVMLAVKLLLLILAVFFVTSSSRTPETAEEELEAMMEAVEDAIVAEAVAEAIEEAVEAEEAEQAEQE